MKKRHWLPSSLILLLTASVVFPVGYLIFAALSRPEGLRQMLLTEPFTLYRFWKSLALCVIVVFLHGVISCMGGFAFAKLRFRWRRGLYFALVVLMMMPVQVTLVPSYIILDRMGLLDTWAALALPAIFSPFGTVLMAQVFRSVPTDILDAARVDGADFWKVLWRIAVPAARGGLVSLILLTFVDVWNMVEQPMVFLQNAKDYPLGVFLAVQSGEAISLAGSLLSMLPVLLLFLYFRDELSEGVEFLGVKG